MQQKINTVREQLRSAQRLIQGISKIPADIEQLRTEKGELDTVAAALSPGRSTTCELSAGSFSFLFVCLVE